jgi:hypothetical protein
LAGKPPLAGGAFLRKAPPLLFVARGGRVVYNPPDGARRPFHGALHLFRHTLSRVGSPRDEFAAGSPLKKFSTED